MGDTNGQVAWDQTGEITYPYLAADGQVDLDDQYNLTCEQIYGYPCPGHDNLYTNVEPRAYHIAMLAAMFMQMFAPASTWKVHNEVSFIGEGWFDLAGQQLGVEEYLT